MNLILCFLNLLLVYSDIYSIQVQTWDGKTISMSSFQGQKILIAQVNADISNREQLLYLDSLQSNTKGLKVLVVPTTDFGVTETSSGVQQLTSSLKLSVTITEPAQVTKSNGQNQNALFKWLTNVSDNTHFNYDVTREGRIYIINENGVLIALLEKGVPRSTIQRILK